MLEKIQVLRDVLQLSMDLSDLTGRYLMYMIGYENIYD